MTSEAARARRYTAWVSLRVGCLLGARANAWHTDVLRALPPDVTPTVIGTSGGRYPVAEIGLPFVALSWDNEVGSWPARKLRNLRYRLGHRLWGDEFQLAPTAELAPFDLLHTWELFTEWTRIALDERRRRGVPVLITVWDNVAANHATDRRRAAVRDRARAEADGFFVVSERSRAMLALEGIQDERIHGARPSVDVARFAPGPADDRRRALGIAPDQVLILAVARLEREKGLGHLLDALALVHRDGLPVPTVIAGSGSLEGHLRRRVRELGLTAGVTFLGELGHRDMPELFRAADIFVLPSVPTRHWAEQWGQSLLEAMASGCACVGSASGSIGETLGDAGVLVPPADPVALAAAIRTLAVDAARRRALGRAARSRVEARFSHRQLADALTDCYRRLVPGQAAGG